jgi:hypothetical protein
VLELREHDLTAALEDHVVLRLQRDRVIVLPLPEEEKRVLALEEESED